MYDTESLKVLCGNSIEEPEVDYDEAEVKSQTGFPVQEEANREYDFTTITDNMNHDDFKENYLEAMQRVRRISLKHQQDLAFAIIQKLPEKYDFQFSIKINPFYSQNDVNELFEFIEFVEYRHEQCLYEIWSYLNPDTNSFDVEKFCEHNTTKILHEIEEQTNRRHYSEMIADFLRTYNKDKMIDWFCKKSKIIRSGILIELMRKE
jgi:hypothetical protein